MRFLVLVTLALAMPLPAAYAQSGTEKQMTHDFSDVTSIESAQALAKEGKLVKILLFPAEFGGEEMPGNVVYVPPEASEAKDLLTGTMIRYYEEGLIDKLEVNAEYKGDSFIPSRILMEASHSSKEGKFNPTIDVW
ncbi:hypothetical protein [Parasphingorhabdus sp.]|uniref:hypothetical protein n=1 Tax=Parasphingorhabdus sp. TaxID=2709688 RepID=UPI003BAE52C9